MFKIFLSAVLLVMGTHILRGAEPLNFVNSPVEIRNFIPDGNISDLPPNTTLKGLNARTVRKRLPGSDEEATVVYIDKKSGQSFNCRVRNTVAVDINNSYQIKLKYATTIQGVQLEIHSYGFHTWGDTTGVQRYQISPNSGMETIEFEYLPPPGTICVGLWLSAPSAAAGEFFLTNFQLSGYGWGCLPEQKNTANPDYLIHRMVYNSKAINSFYFGKESRMGFHRNEFFGFGNIKLPAGALTPLRKGTYKTDLTLRQLGNGPIIKEYSGTIELADSNPPPKAIDLGSPGGSFELHYKTWDDTGKLVRREMLTIQQFSKTPLKDGYAYRQMPARETSTPSGYITIDAGEEKIRDFTADSKISAKVSSGPVPVDSKLSVRLQDFTGTELSRKEASIKPQDTVYLELESPVLYPDVYEIVTELSDSAGNLLDMASLQIGYRTPARTAVKPSMPDFYFSEELAVPSARYAKSAQDTVKRYVAMVKEHGSNVAGFGYQIASFNPLPGVYRFHELDEWIAVATREGLKSEIYLHIHGEWVPYADFEQPVDQHNVRDNTLSIASNAVRQITGEAFGALAAYYRGNPDVVAFGHWGPVFDWYYRDNNDRHYDYSPSALAQWREFSGGMEPPNTFRGETDLSPQWRKWCEFRSYLIRKWLIDTIGENVRKFDNDRFLIAYAMTGGLGDIERLWPDFKRLNMIPAHGGSDSWDIPRHLELAAQYGLIFRHESVAAPERHVINVDSQIVHGLQGGIANDFMPMWNIAWNLGFNLTAKQSGVETALKHRRQLLELVTDMHRQKYERSPIQWAQLYSWDQAMLKSKAFQWFSLGTDLFAGNRGEQLSSAAVSDRTPVELWRKYPLVMAFTPGVWSAETVEKMKAYLNGGGTLALVLSPDNDTKAIRDAFGVQVKKAGKIQAVSQGTGTVFPATRRVVMNAVAEYDTPSTFVPILVDSANKPWAWETRFGKGRLLLFSGTFIHLQSAGYLEDILNSVGLKRLFKLSAGTPDDRLMGIEFVNPQADMIIWFYESLPWNGHGPLLQRVISKKPTWDGVAEVTGRKTVKLQLFLPENGNFQVDRWIDGQWKNIGSFSSRQLGTDGVSAPLAPGENGIMRFRQIK